jgi:hypothetical protein
MKIRVLQDRWQEKQSLGAATSPGGVTQRLAQNSESKSSRDRDPAWERNRNGEKTRQRRDKTETDGDWRRMQDWNRWSQKLRPRTNTETRMIDL